MPINTKAGKTSKKYEPSTPARLNQARPAAMSSSAGSSALRAPKRVIRRAENPRVITPIVMEIGRNAAPVASASNPRTRWRYSADRKNIPSMPATASICARFAPATSRERRMPNRSSGFEAVACRTTNAISSKSGHQPERPGVRVDDRVDGEHQGRRDQDRARGIGARGPPEPGLVRHQAHGHDQNQHADRHVDEEDPVPVQRLGHHAAEQLADRRARRAHEAEDADRLRLLAGLREHRDDHAEDDG